MLALLATPRLKHAQEQDCNNNGLPDTLDLAPVHFAFEPTTSLEFGGTALTPLQS